MLKEQNILPRKNLVRLARFFHNTYERLAPSEIRKDTKEFDPESPNGKLMISVCIEAAKFIEINGERRE